MEIFLLVLSGALVFAAPLSSGLVRQFNRKHRISADNLMIILVCIFSITIVSYAWLMMRTSLFVLHTYGTDLTSFLNEPLNGKGLLFFSTLVYGIYCGWNFLLYPLIRDFEQYRNEAKQQKRLSDHKARQKKSQG
jgi:hypothetical protein